MAITITRELQETIKKNPKIKNVYFSEEGHWYFTKNTIEVHVGNDRNESTEKMKVETLPKTKTGVLLVKMGNELRAKKVFVDYTPVHKTFTREEILGMTALPEKKSKEDEDKVLQEALAILKSRETHKLLEEGLKGQDNN